MIATAAGADRSKPTQVFPTLKHERGIKTLGAIPRGPTILLTPEEVTRPGQAPITKPVYWQVWWNAGAQTKAGVCLKGTPSPLAAEAELKDLATQIQNPSLFDHPGVLYAGSRQFTLAGIPGAFGYLSHGTEGSASKHISFEVRFAGFHSGPNIALISMVAYGRTTNSAEFLAFARAEYAALGGPLLFSSRQLAFLLVMLVGVAAIAFDLTRRRHRSTLASRTAAWETLSNVQEPPLTLRHSDRVESSATSARSSDPGPPRSSPKADDEEGKRPAGWYVDPTVPVGREPFRYWDGSKWIDGNEADRD
jgi:hypothetical protein